MSALARAFPGYAATLASRTYLLGDVDGRSHKAGSHHAPPTSPSLPMLEHIQRVWEGGQGAYPVTLAFLGLTETLLIAGVNEACVKVFSLLLALKSTDLTCVVSCACLLRQLPEVVLFQSNSQPLPLLGMSALGHSSYETVCCSHMWASRSVTSSAAVTAGAMPSAARDGTSRQQLSRSCRPP